MWCEQIPWYKLFLRPRVVIASIGVGAVLTLHSSGVAQASVTLDLLPQSAAQEHAEQRAEQREAQQPQIDPHQPPSLQNAMPAHTHSTDESILSGEHSISLDDIKQLNLQYRQEQQEQAQSPAPAATDTNLPTSTIDSQLRARPTMGSAADPGFTPRATTETSTSTSTAPHTATSALGSSSSSSSAIPPIGPATTTTPKSSSLIEQQKGTIYRDAFGNKITRPVEETLKAGANPNSALAESIPVRPEQGAMPPAESASTTTTTSQLNTGSAINTDTTANGKGKGNAADADSLSPEAINPMANPRIAVLYFSQQEQVRFDSTDIDELTGASIIIDEHNHKRGLVEYIGREVQELTHSDIYQLMRTSPYPMDHDELIYQASLELDRKERPDVIIYPPFDPANYDVIFVGYPIWWYDLPMPLYSFFEQYDLSGKVIVPYCVHGGSRPYSTFAQMSKLEPNALVLYNHGLVIERYDVVAQGKERVQAWIKDLRLFFKQTRKEMRRYYHRLQQQREQAQSVAPASQGSEVVKPAASVVTQP